MGRAHVRDAFNGGGSQAAPQVRPPAAGVRTFVRAVSRADQQGAASVRPLSPSRPAPPAAVGRISYSTAAGRPSRRCRRSPRRTPPAASESTGSPPRAPSASRPSPDAAPGAALRGERPHTVRQPDDGRLRRQSRDPSVRTVRVPPVQVCRSGDGPAGTATKRIREQRRRCARNATRTRPAGKRRDSLSNPRHMRTIRLATARNR